VRGARDRDLAIGQVVARSHERQRLDRLRRAAHEAGKPAVAGLPDDRAVANGDGVHAMPRLERPVPMLLDDERFHRRAEPTLLGDGSAAHVRCQPL
jgi:hypothetical protein